MKQTNEPQAAGWSKALQAAREASRCGVRTRSGAPCRGAAMPNGRCRMHGGKAKGAPKGNSHAFKHGRYTAEHITERRHFADLLREMKGFIDELEAMED